MYVSLGVVGDGVGLSKYLKTGVGYLFVERKLRRIFIFRGGLISRRFNLADEI